jgi:hypothetical protein
MQLQDLKRKLDENHCPFLQWAVDTIERLQTGLRESESYSDALIRGPDY